MQIGQLAFIDEELHNEVIVHYKYFHQHPEVSLQEKDTSAYIQKELRKLGIAYHLSYGYSIIADIGKRNNSKALLLRVDMDALEIEEETNLPYKSIRPGLMHACGHDAHLAVALGIASFIQKRKINFPGFLRIAFQSSEEKPPGGAKFLLDDGLLKNPDISAALGIHTNPFLEAGEFGLKGGPFLAASDRFKITIIGEAGHGGYPEQGIDAIAIAGQFINDLQNIISRQISSTQKAVITIGKIKGGNRANVIADRVNMEGTVRSFDLDIREKIVLKMEKLLKGITSFWQADYEFQYFRGYPPLINNERMVAFAKESIVKLFGSKSVKSIESLMSGDDFAYIAQEIPAVFLEWGVGFKEKKKISWHHPLFKVNLAAFPYAVAALIQIIFDFFEGEF